MVVVADKKIQKCCRLTAKGGGRLSPNRPRHPRGRHPLGHRSEPAAPLGGPPERGGAGISGGSPWWCLGPGGTAWRSGGGMRGAWRVAPESTSCNRRSARCTPELLSQSGVGHAARVKNPRAAPAIRLGARDRHGATFFPEAVPCEHRGAAPAPPARLGPSASRWKCVYGVGAG